MGQARPGPERGHGILASLRRCYPKPKHCLSAGPTASIATHACSRTSSTLEERSLMKRGTALWEMTTWVCVEVPEAMSMISVATICDDSTYWSKPRQPRIAAWYCCWKGIRRIGARHRIQSRDRWADSSPWKAVWISVYFPAVPPRTHFLNLVVASSCASWLSE